ncbi:putative hydrocephalus-inducing protein-like [Apostichopus japonicus]|uniref:Putative hydrocephalus-inducing protein-like n=1 Tax=Stichopus japonicus TaxID=307972 RepID=A0A2G8KXR9_STIJA|nr:putative hydrocephalus-inducing protein-like [Apostichopus japonicus]
MKFFDWTVDGLPEKIQIHFKGSVIGPTFHFDVPKLKFGTVSYGFKCTKIATLVNTALVPMTFKLRVPSDGHGKVISVTAGDETLGKTNVNISPKEFEIEPESGSIPPQSEMKIAIALTSNTTKKYDLSLVVDVEGVGEEILNLPITAKCVVSPVGILTPILDYTRCFLNHPYEQNAQIINDSDLPVKYDLIPQEVDETTALLYSSPQPSGIIPAQSTAEIAMVITPRALEEIDTLAEFSIFGSIQPPLQVQLMCVGEGPVVHVDPVELDWGQTPVLSDLSKSVVLSNESLIPAPFICAMMRPKSLWKVEPAEGVIPPEECVEVKLTVNLDDNIRCE